MYPYDHYWHVAGDETQAFASRRRQFVPFGDVEFAAWRAAGEAPSRIASLAELRDVLAPYGLALAGERPAARFDDDPRWRILFEWMLTVETRLRALGQPGAANRAALLQDLRNLQP